MSATLRGCIGYIEEYADAETVKAFVKKGIGKVGFLEQPIPADPDPTSTIIGSTSASICMPETHTTADPVEQGSA